MKWVTATVFWTKHFFSSRNLVILALLTATLFYGVYRGAVELEKIRNDANTFKRTEAYNFEYIKSYYDYSFTGFDVFFYPAASSVFFSNPVMFSELSANINSILATDITGDCKSRYIFKGNALLRFRFSDLVLVFAGLAALLLGLESLKYRELMRSLASRWSPAAVYISGMVTRLVLMVSCFTVILGGSLLFLTLRGVPVTSSDGAMLLVYLASTGLVLTLFFVLGSILGCIPRRVVRVSGVLAIMIAIFIALPTVFDSIIEEKAKDINPSLYFDNKKAVILDNFETSARERFGPAKTNTAEGRREVADYYLTREFPKVEQEDFTQREKIAGVVKEYFRLYEWSPVTFYTMTCQELSSRGFTGYLHFYDYILNLRREFVKFWIDRTYYQDPKEIVNFIKGDENIFKSVGHVPPGYMRGFLIQVGYIALFAVGSFLSFLVLLYYIDKMHVKWLGTAAVELKAGELNVKLVKGDYLRNALYAALSGRKKRLAKKGFTVTFSGAGVQTAAPVNGIGLVYIPHPGEFPGDVKVRNLAVFYGRLNGLYRLEIDTVLSGEEIGPLLNKKLGQLEDDEVYWVCKALLGLSRGEVYLIDDIVADVQVVELYRFKKLLEGLVDSGAKVIFLTAPRFVSAPVFRKGSCFEDGRAWILRVHSDALAYKYSKKTTKKQVRG